jgi:hypothetical protein
LAIVHNSPHTFSSQLGDVNNRVLVSVAICGEVPKVGNASDEAAITLAMTVAQYQILYIRSPLIAREVGASLSPPSRRLISSRAHYARD